MDSPINLQHMAGALIYSIVGLIVLMGGFWIMDRLTPYDLWKDLIEEKNVALAITVGALSIGISIIIASAIHG